MRLLLISNSTNAGEAYLEYSRVHIKNFLGNFQARCLFIPYAGVSLNFNDYSARVKQKFEEAGHIIDPIHNYSDPVKAAKEAEVIVVGGGNTFQLIKLLQDNNLIEIIRKKVLSGTPYIGWSAGANVACPTIRTTNDMPIVQPESFDAFNLVSFQINPHYIDVHPDGHAGETREARIEEFIEINQNIYVLGLREGTMLFIENKNIELIGKRNVRIFRYGIKPLEVSPGGDLNFLINED
jgi:dipeptidase E